MLSFGDYLYDILARASRNLKKVMLIRSMEFERLTTGSSVKNAQMTSESMRFRHSHVHLWDYRMFRLFLFGDCFPRFCGVRLIFVRAIFLCRTKLVRSRRLFLQERRSKITTALIHILVRTHGKQVIFRSR